MQLSNLTEAKFPKTHAVLRQGIAEGVAPGFAAGLWSFSQPTLAQVAVAGFTSNLPDKRPVESGTVFDYASVTKVFATTALAAVLKERGWIDWETPLHAVLPEYPHAGDIRLRHLLAHTAGFPAWEPLWQRMREHFYPKPVYTARVKQRQQVMRDLVYHIRPEALPEERALYSDISFLLLGFALEEVTQMPLYRAVREYVWKPMGIHHAYYHRVTQLASLDRDPVVAATEDSEWRGGVLQGQVHDDNCWAMGGYGGHAGAFGNVEELLRFSSKLLTGFFSADTLRDLWTPVTRPPNCSRTLGWDTRSGENPATGRHFSSRSVGHLGFSGTSLWIDPEKKIAVTLLSNRVHPSRENILIRAFRPRFHDAILEDFLRLEGVPR